MRIDKYVLIVSVLVAFSGCAKDTPFIEAKRLLSEGRVDMGLAALERAAREDPITSKSGRRSLASGRQWLHVCFWKQRAPGCLAMREPLSKNIVMCSS